MKHFGCRVGRVFLLLAYTVIPLSAHSAPIYLDGMGIVGQWTDFENTGITTPSNPWGNSDILDVDRVGFHIEYANGLIGTATYSGVSGFWGGCCSVGGSGSGIAYDTATGFFDRNGVFNTSNNQLYGNLHGLDNNGFLLTAAWTDLRNSFTGNFDIGYENRGNSDWRASSSGWESVVITFYSSAITQQDIPEPSALVLFGLGLVGMTIRRKRA